MFFEYVLRNLSTISSNILTYTFFWYCSHLLLNFLFTFLANLSGGTDFSSLCVEYISMPLSYNHNFIGLLVNLTPWSIHDLFKTFWNVLLVAKHFFSVDRVANPCCICQYHAVKSDSFTLFVYYFHVCNISATNDVFLKRIYFVSLEFFGSCVCSISFRLFAKKLLTIEARFIVA